MKVFFKTKKIEEICSIDKVMNKKYGASNVKKLKQRLQQLKAASQLSHFKFDNPHPLKGNKLGSFSVALQGGLRIIFEPHQPMPLKPDGKIDWENVQKIIITNIEDYHK